MGISLVYFGNLAVIYRFRTATSGCVYLANAASGKGFKLMRGNFAAHFCAVQSVSNLLSICLGKSLTSITTMLKFEKKRDSVNFARMIALSGAPI